MQSTLKKLTLVAAFVGSLQFAFVQSYNNFSQSSFKPKKTRKFHSFDKLEELLQIFFGLNLPEKENFLSLEKWMTRKELAAGLGRDVVEVDEQMQAVTFELLEILCVKTSDITFLLSRFNELIKIVREIIQKNTDASSYVAFWDGFLSQISDGSVQGKEVIEANCFLEKSITLRKDFVEWFKTVYLLSYQSMHLPVKDLEQSKKMVLDQISIAKQLLPELKVLTTKWGQE